MGHSPAMAKRQPRVPNLRAYAVIGAEQRLLQIAEEARAIFKAFPELRAPNRGFGARGGGEHPFPWEPQSAEGESPSNGRKRKRTKAEDVGGGTEANLRGSEGTVGEAEANGQVSCFRGTSVLPLDADIPTAVVSARSEIPISALVTNRLERTSLQENASA